MSKKTQKESQLETKDLKAFTLLPKQGGYSVVEICFDSNGQVKSKTEVHQPDVLPIALSILNQKIRKELEV